MTNVIDTIGATPLVSLEYMTRGLPDRVLVKLENRNPQTSVKDRIGKAMIEAAEKRGELAPGWDARYGRGRVPSVW